MYPAGGEHFWYGGWWMLPMIMPIIFLIICLVILFFFFGRVGFRTPWERYHEEADSPLDILKKRYAKGEITKDEFERIKKDLLS